MPSALLYVPTVKVRLPSTGTAGRARHRGSRRSGGNIFRRVGERDFGERDVRERHFGDLWATPDVDRCCHNIGCALRPVPTETPPTYTHLVALDDDSDVVGLTGYKLDARACLTPH